VFITLVKNFSAAHVGIYRKRRKELYVRQRDNYKKERNSILNATGTDEKAEISQTKKFLCAGREGGKTKIPKKSPHKKRRGKRLLTLRKKKRRNAPMAEKRR